VAVAIGSFLNPALLWLAIGALAPIIIHLAARNRPKPTPFPAVRFILASQRRSSARFRLKQLLLLLLRISVLGLFAFVLARPWVTGGEAGAATRSQTTVTAVFLLDNSYSMGYEHDGSTSFEKARQMALAAVDAFAVGESRVCLLLVGDTPQPVIKDFEHAYDLDALRARLREARLSARGTDCTQAVAEAARMLRGVTGVGKAVFLFTDLTAHAWPRPLPEPDAPDDIIYYIVDAGPAKPVNTAVLGVTAPSGAAPGAPFEVTARIDAVGSAGRQAELLIDGEVRSRKPANAHQVESVAFVDSAIRAGAREHWGAVTIPGQDSLPIDNSMYFTLRSAPPLQVVLVNGSPSGIARRDELFFLRKALAPGGMAGGDIAQVRDITPAQVEQADLGDADVLALCNVGSLPIGAWTKVRTFVSTGHGLAVWGGNNVLPAGYEPVTAGATALLPCSIGPPVSPPEPAHIEPGELKHPILRLFREGGRNGDLAAARFNTYLKLAPNDAVPNEIVLRFKNGDPAIVAGRYGTGRVLVFASTCDVDWTNQPIDIPFVVLVHESMRFLSAPREQKRDVLVGSAPSLRITAPDKVRSITLARLAAAGGPEPPAPGTPADAKPEDVTPRLDVRSGQLNLAAVDEPGVYRVAVTRTGERSPEELLFAVNLETGESDVTRVPDDPKAIQSLLPKRTLKIARQSSELLDQISRAESIAELSSPLAGIVLVILLGEMYLSNHMRSRVKQEDEAEAVSSQQ